MSGVVELYYDPSLHGRDLRRMHMQDRWLNPAFRKHMLAKRICLVCGLSSTAGGLGLHQKASGHKGSA